MTELPDGWDVVEVKDVAQVVRGVTYKKSDSEVAAGDGLVPLLRATNFEAQAETGGDLVYVPERLVKPDQVLREGDTLIATSSGSISVVGKSVQIGTESERRTFGAFCGVLRPRETTNARYLHMFCASPSVRQQWADAARGTNINNLKPRSIESTPIPLPPASEQAEIVRILDMQLARLDTVLEAVQAVRDRADQLRRSLLHAAFTGQLTNLSGVASERLESALDLLIDHRGKTPKKLGGDFAATGVRVISAIHIKNRQVRFEERHRFVDESIFLKWMPERTRRGDVLLTSEAPLGAVAPVPDDEPLVLSQRLFCLRGKGGVLRNSFLRYFLESPQAQDDLRRRSSGTTVTGIRQSELRLLRIPLPSVAAQDDIVGILDTQLARLEQSLSVADRVEAECGRLRRSLLQAAFTGELTKTWREANG